jgi:hypothetical protein
MVEVAPSTGSDCRYAVMSDLKDNMPVAGLNRIVSELSEV